MDDSGITQVLDLLSEPSLPTTEGKGGGVGGGEQEEGGRRQACQPAAHRLAFPKGAQVPPVFLNATTSKKTYLLHSEAFRGRGAHSFTPPTNPRSDPQRAAKT